MDHRLKRIAIAILFVFTRLAVNACYAEIRLPQLISDNMVLQRDVKIKVWGWASPNETVTVSFNRHTQKTRTAINGKWATVFAPMAAGGPYTMDIRGNNHIVIHDILIGDVWFCSGQSNMVLSMERVKEKYPDDIASANYPQIRNFFIPTVSDVARLHDDLPPGKWKTADPVNVLDFGAATCFFARQIYQKYHVPIGIINSSVGGTPIEAWISENGFKQLPAYQARVAKFRDTAYMKGLIRNGQPLKPLKKEPVDKGLSGEKPWFDTTYVPEGWHKFWLPGYWADQGVKGLNGTVWFRKEINVPASMAGKPAKLFMGRIVDADQTYLNGTWVGGVGYQYPPRRYNVPAGLLKAGRNVLVVKVINTAGKGGFVPDKPYYLSVGAERMDLRGDWIYKVGNVFEPDNGAGNEAFSAQNEPTGLYNTMVAPVINYALKGVLWYQGESNTSRSKEYQYLLTALISDWRSKWNAGNLPFIYAQLPNFNEVQYSPAESQWAELRQGQLNALALPNTGMAVTIDAGEWNDIHPLNKKDVGERLALAAEKVAYHNQTVVASGPIYRSCKINGNKIVLSFTNTGSGLIAKGGGELTYFAIAGEDKKYIWANARIEGGTVVVWSDNISNPMYVRYAWADNPEGANLYNKEGLPASPFTTDSQ